MLWDFDGTLAVRDGMWSGCVLEVLERRVPGHGLELADVRAALRGIFPWHEPERAHPELCDPEAWWQHVAGAIARSLESAGLGSADARGAAAGVRARYTDPELGWRVRAGAADALELLADDGWRSAILSNHVPELGEIVRRLGLAEHVDAIFSSALTGFEKPNPAAFRYALDACGAPAAVWMVGDSESADVRGARAIGIPALHVGAAAGRDDGDLLAAAELIIRS